MGGRNGVDLGMTMMDRILVVLFFFGAICLFFAVAGIIADYILPRIPFVERYLDKLPMMWMHRKG